jgi:hypothetical protein
MKFWYGMTGPCLSTTPVFRDDGVSLFGVIGSGNQSGRDEKSESVQGVIEHFR